MAQDWLQADIFRGASGWISDDIFAWIRDSYAYSRWIDVRDNWKSISLSKAFVADYTPDQPVNVIIRIKSGDTLAFWNNGWIFKKTAWVWSKVTTATPANPIISACEFNWYIYRTQNTLLHRIKSSDFGANITGVEILWFHALNNTTYHPLLVSMWSMYIGNGEQYSEIDINNTFNDITVIEKWSTIKKLMDLWGVIRVVTESEIGMNTIYLFDKAWEFADQAIPLWGAWIKNGIVFEWYTYIITKWGLTALDWYKLYKLKDVTDTSDFMETIVNYKDKLVIWWVGAIYTRGKKNKNYTDVLVSEWVTSNNQPNDVMRAIFSTGDDLYVAWSNGATNKIDKLSDTTYAQTGELITRAYYGNDLHTVKQWIDILYWFKTLIANQEIELLYSIDGWSYKSIVNITSAQDWNPVWSRRMLTLWEFQYIQFKILLRWPWTSTPTFYSMDFRFNITKV